MNSNVNRLAGAPISTDSVLLALHILHNESQHYKMADQWLTHFQEAPEAWPVVLALIGHDSIEVQIFAAQCLKSKIYSQQGKELPSAKRQELQRIIIERITVSPAGGRAKSRVLNHLSLSLCGLIVYDAPHNPTQSLADVLQFGKQGETQMMISLKILEELPGQTLHDTKLCPLMAREPTMSAFRSQAPEVAQLLQGLLLGNNPALCIESLKVVVAWIQGGFLPSELISNVLLQPALGLVRPITEAQLQIKPSVVLPLVLDVVAQLLGSSTADLRTVIEIFRWMHLRLTGWLQRVCTGVDPRIQHEGDYGTGSAASTRLATKILGLICYGVIHFIQEIAVSKAPDQLAAEDTQRVYMSIIEMLLIPLQDTRLSVSLLAINPLFLFLQRVCSELRETKTSYVIRADDGAWIHRVCRSILGSVMTNVCFSYQNSDITYLWGETLSDNEYQEEMINYRGVRDSTMEAVDSSAAELITSLSEVMIHTATPNMMVTLICQQIQQMMEALAANPLDNLCARKLESSIWTLAHAADDSKVAALNKDALLHVCSLLFSIPFNPLMSGASSLFLQMHYKILDGASEAVLESGLQWMMSMLRGIPKRYIVGDMHEFMLRPFQKICMCKSMNVRAFFRQNAMRIAQMAESTIKPPEDPATEANRPFQKLYGKPKSHASKPTAREQEVALECRNIVATGLIRLAMGSKGPCPGGSDLIRWVVFPSIQVLNAWVVSADRRKQPGISNELYFLSKCLRALSMSRTARLYPELTPDQQPEEPPIPRGFPGVPQSDAPVVLELCDAVLYLCEGLVENRFVDDNVVESLTSVLQYVGILCAHDTTNMNDAQWRVISTLVERGTILYAAATTGFKLIVETFLGVINGLLGVVMQTNSYPYETQAEFQKRTAFLIQLTHAMCSIGENSLRQIPAQRPDHPPVAMGEVVAARFEYVFHYLDTVNQLYPKVFHQARAANCPADTPPFSVRAITCVVRALGSCSNRRMMRSAYRLIHSMLNDQRDTFDAMAVQLVVQHANDVVEAVFRTSQEALRQITIKPPLRREATHLLAGRLLHTFSVKAPQPLGAAVGTCVAKVVASRQMPNSDSLVIEWITTFSQCSSAKMWHDALLAFLKPFCTV